MNHDLKKPHIDREILHTLYEACNRIERNKEQRLFSTFVLPIDDQR